MGLTQEQHLRVSQMIRENPHQRRSIEEHARDLALEQEGTLARSGNLFAEGIVGGLTMGFGQPDTGREARDSWEMFAQSAGHLIGALPSLWVTGGLAGGVGAGGNIAARGITRLVGASGAMGQMASRSPTAARVLGMGKTAKGGLEVTNPYLHRAARDAGMLGLHTAASKQEGETVSEYAGNMATSGLKSAGMGYGFGLAGAAVSPTSSVLGEKLTQAFGDRAMKYGIRPTAMTATGTGIGVAEGVELKDALVQNMAMGILTMMEPVRPFISHRKSVDVLMNAEQYVRQGRPLHINDQRQILEMAKDMPEIFKSYPNHKSEINQALGWLNNMPQADADMLFGARYINLRPASPLQRLSAKQKEEKESSHAIMMAASSTPRNLVPVIREALTGSTMGGGFGGYSRGRTDAEVPPMGSRTPSGHPAALAGAVSNIEYQLRRIGRSGTGAAEASRGHLEAARDHLAGVMQKWSVRRLQGEWVDTEVAAWKDLWEGGEYKGPEKTAKPDLGSTVRMRISDDVELEYTVPDTPVKTRTLVTEIINTIGPDYESRKMWLESAHGIEFNRNKDPIHERVYNSIYNNVYHKRTAALNDIAKQANADAKAGKKDVNPLWDIEEQQTYNSIHRINEPLMPKADREIPEGPRLGRGVEDRLPPEADFSRKLKRLTYKNINNALPEGVELVKGEGYHYFVGDAVPPMESTSVLTTRLSGKQHKGGPEITIEWWVKQYHDMVAEASKKQGKGDPRVDVDAPGTWGKAEWKIFDEGVNAAKEGRERPEHLLYEQETDIWNRGYRVGKGKLELPSTEKIDKETGFIRQTLEDRKVTEVERALAEPASPKPLLSRPREGTPEAAVRDVDPLWAKEPAPEAAAKEAPPAGLPGIPEGESIKTRTWTPDALEGLNNKSLDGILERSGMKKIGGRPAKIPRIRKGQGLRDEIRKLNGDESKVTDEHRKTAKNLGIADESLTLWAGTERRLGPGAAHKHESLIEDMKESASKTGLSSYDYKNIPSDNAAVEMILNKHLQDRFGADLTIWNASESQLKVVQDVVSINLKNAQIHGEVKMSAEGQMNTLDAFRAEWDLAFTRISEWFKSQGNAAMRNKQGTPILRGDVHGILREMMDRSFDPEAKLLRREEVATSTIIELDRMGYVVDHPEGMRLTELGRDVMVSNPFVLRGREGETVYSTSDEAVVEQLQSQQAMSHRITPDQYVVRINESGPKREIEVVFDPYNPKTLIGMDLTRPHGKAEKVETSLHQIGPNEGILMKDAGQRIWAAMQKRRTADIWFAAKNHGLKKGLEEMQLQAEQVGGNFYEKWGDLPERIVRDHNDVFSWKFEDRLSYDPEFVGRTPKFMLGKKGKVVFDGYEFVIGAPTDISMVDIMSQGYDYVGGRRIVKIDGEVREGQVTAAQLLEEGRIDPWMFEAARTLKGLTSEFADAAAAQGIKVRDNSALNDTGNVRDFYPKSLYFPVRVDPKIYASGVWKDKMAADLVKNGQAENLREAKEQVDRFLAYSENKSRQLGALENARTVVHKDGFVVNPEMAYGVYFRGATQRLTDAYIFGRNNELINPLLTDFRLEGGNEQTAKKILQRFLGQEELNTSTEAALAAVRSFTAVTRMGWSWLPQFSQVVNSATLMGYKRAYSTLLNTISKEGKEFGDMVGASTLETVKGEFAAAIGEKSAKWNKVPWLKWFLSSDTFQRRWAANMSVGYLEYLARGIVKDPHSKKFRRMIEEGGIDPNRVHREMTSNGELSSETSNVFAFNMSEKTQFLTRPENMPHYWNSGAGRTLAQFKTFIYHQQNFLREVMGNAPDARTQAERMLRYSIGAMVGGELVADILSVVRSQQREEFGPERLFQNLMYSGGLGMGLDVIRAAVDGRAAAWEFVGGPNLGTAVRMTADTAGAFGKVLSDAIDEKEDVDLVRSFRAPLRTSLRMIPLVGTSIARQAVPAQRTRFKTVNPWEGPTVEFGPIPVPQGLAQIIAGKPVAGPELHEHIRKHQRAMRRLKKERWEKSRR